MKEIKLEELKVIQMDILSAVHNFCAEHGIKYSLACGTMLGAARHHGYIPWDDDIDIYLLRQDYNKLIQMFPDYLDGKYRFVTLERNKKWNRAYGKIYDSRTILKELSKTPFQLGVNIDVFPIDKVPENKSVWEVYNKIRRFFQNVYSIKVMEFRRERNACKNISLFFGKVLLIPFSSRVIALLLKKIATKYNAIPSKLVFETVQGLYQKNPFPMTLFDKLGLYQFEDRQYYGFLDADTYLTNGFGNWKQLPPKHKQVSHHVFKAYWV